MNWVCVRTVSFRDWELCYMAIMLTYNLCFLLFCIVYVILRVLITPEGKEAPM